MTVAGGFYAAEGLLDFGANRGGVELVYSGVEVADGGEGAVDVASVERR